ncbi:hypothetical protein PsorP6_017927 [Peronosclerospora sorghi]|uniref:Uncharacterized protein n=1 Tax=Peronosclerospora sorghi TaxID=230839 RepID=A0ACC0WDK1_9STRA|nr:hypothetical protein PsorP6_017927 [Peronosclerospora sorghi]
MDRLKRPNCVGLDSSVLLNSAVWTASGHVDNFTDPMAVCRSCNSRVRVDQLLESKLQTQHELDVVASMSLAEMDELIRQLDIACPKCNQTRTFQPAKHFNLLFRTNMGATDETCDWIYLRPETAQGAYINFVNVQSAMRKKLPFGIGQMGKSFRNEISPGHYLFRTREFEQLELQFFTHPSESDRWYHYWVDQCYDFLIKYGIKPENLRKHQHAPEELAHYARATTDIQFNYPFGWSELWGIANRTSYDLKKHMDASGKSLMCQDVVAKEEFLPHVIEPALGAGRIMFSMLLDAYDEEEVSGRKRTVLRLHPDIAPYRFAVLPLVKNEPLVAVAEQLFESLCESAAVDYDLTGSIGRRYRRQDEIGTPMCLTVDFDTLEDKCVTVRDRDSMEQKRVRIERLLQDTSRTVAEAVPKASKKSRRNTVVSEKCLRLLYLKHEIQTDVKVLKAVVDEVDVLRLCHSFGMTLSQSSTASMHEFELGMFDPEDYDADFARFMRESVLAGYCRKNQKTAQDDNDLKICCLFGKQLEVKAELGRMGFWDGECEEGLSFQDQGVFCMKSDVDCRQLVAFAWLGSNLFESETIRDTPAYQVEQTDSVTRGPVTKTMIPNIKCAKSVWLAGGVVPTIAVEGSTPLTTEWVEQDVVVSRDSFAQWMWEKHQNHAINLPFDRIQVVSALDDLLMKFRRFPDKKLRAVRIKYNGKVEERKRRDASQTHEQVLENYRNIV